MADQPEPRTKYMTAYVRLRKARQSDSVMNEKYLSICEPNIGPKI